LLPEHDNEKSGYDRPPLAENERLQAAIDARDRYLANHPHLAAYQAEIDRIMDNSGNREGRMAVLGTLIQGKMLEMKNELEKLMGLLPQG